MPDTTISGLVIRPAGPDQGELVAPLMRSTHPPLYDELFQGNMDLFRKVGRALWESEGALNSHQCAHGAYIDGQIVGIEIGGDITEAAAREAADGEVFKSNMPVQSHEFFTRGWRDRWSYAFPRFPEGTYYVGELAVAEALHGKGIGRLLLQAAFDRAKANGYRDVQLDLYSTNPAYNFYLAMGMEKLSETHVTALEDTPTPLHYRMVKHLN